MKQQSDLNLVLGILHGIVHTDPKNTELINYLRQNLASSKSQVPSFPSTVVIGRLIFVPPQYIKCARHLSNAWELFGGYLDAFDGQKIGKKRWLSSSVAMETKNKQF